MNLKDIYCINGYFKDDIHFVRSDECKTLIAECQEEFGYVHYIFFQVTPKGSFTCLRRIDDIINLVSKCKYFKVKRDDPIFDSLEQSFSKVVSANESSKEVTKMLGRTPWI